MSTQTKRFRILTVARHQRRKKNKKNECRNICTTAEILMGSLLFCNHTQLHSRRKRLAKKGLKPQDSPYYDPVKNPHGMPPDEEELKRAAKVGLQGGVRRKIPRPDGAPPPPRAPVPPPPRSAPPPDAELVPHPRPDLLIKAEQERARRQADAQAARDRRSALQLAQANADGATGANAIAVPQRPGSIGPPTAPTTSTTSTTTTTSNPAAAAAATAAAAAAEADDAGDSAKLRVDPAALRLVPVELRVAFICLRSSICNPYVHTRHDNLLVALDCVARETCSNRDDNDCDDCNVNVVVEQQRN